jgi:hypothetical protein
VRSGSQKEWPGAALGALGAALDVLPQVNLAFCREPWLLPESSSPSARRALGLSSLTGGGTVRSGYQTLSVAVSVCGRSKGLLGWGSSGGRWKIGGSLDAAVGHASCSSNATQLHRGIASACSPAAHATHRGRGALCTIQLRGACVYKGPYLCTHLLGLQCWVEQVALLVNRLRGCLARWVGGLQP